MSGKRPHNRTADLVFFDPGETTGVAILAIEPRWLAGEGDADWEGLRRAIRSSWFGQLGADAREWSGERASVTQDPNVVPTKLFSGPPIGEGATFELNQIFAARDILDSWPGAAWGYEDYVPESMAAAQKGALTPMRFFSTLAFSTVMDDSRPRVPFVQSRSMKSSAPDERMKMAGLYFPGMPHAVDAARHACVFARSARQRSTVREAAWPRLFQKESP